MKKRIIWSNNDYAEWENAMLEDGYSEEEISYELYCEDKEFEMQDERDNLNINVNGCIIAIADLGLWNGRRNAAKIVGYNVKDILYSNCDFVTWYCDRYNVCCDGVHHDGTNYITYRVAESREAAEELIDKIISDKIGWKQLMRRTRSLRPYVAKVYGW